MNGPRFNRRELLVAGAGAGIALGLRATALAQSGHTALDFASLGDGAGWPGWVCPGVANLRRAGGAGMLEAGPRRVPLGPPPGAFAPQPGLPRRGSAAGPRAARGGGRGGG